MSRPRFQLLLTGPMLAAALLASMSCGSSSSAVKTPSADKTNTPARLAYVTVEAPTGDLSSAVSRIYVVTPGDVAQQVREVPGAQYYEMLASPNGHALAVNASGIMVILDALGNELMRLDTPLVSFSGAGPFASWSPDSTVFAYSRADYSASDPSHARGWIETVDVANRTITTAAKLKDAPLSMPSFSPDGRHFAAIETADASNHSSALAIADGTGDYHLLSGQPSDTMAMPIWSPDGSRIVYWLPNGASQPDGRELPEGMYVAPSTGGTPKRIAEASYPSAQAWSPDGARLALTCIGRSNDVERKVTGSNICLVDLAGGDPSLVTDDGTSFAAAFAPDGASIAYLTARDSVTGTFTLKVVRLDTHEVRTIASSVLFGGFSWLGNK